MSFYDSKSIVKNLIGLWEQNRFPGLKNLAMEYPFDVKDEIRVTDAFLKFLRHHKTTLEKFKLCVNLMPLQEPEELEAPEDRDWIQRSKAVSKTLHLRDIEIIITSIFKVFLSKIWLGFVESQRCLESITIATFRLNSDILPKICECNYRTITKMCLTRLSFNTNGRYSPISFSVLKNCTRLQELFLEGIYTGDLGPGLFEAQELPQSLTQIDIGGITLASQDLTFILTGLENLEQIYLTGVGHSGNLGVTIDAIKEVIVNRKIRKISLYGSINGKFPDEGISNGSTDSPVQLTCRPFGMLELNLGVDEYYHVIPRPPLLDTFMSMADFDGD
jgi:hypothetical protein